MKALFTLTQSVKAVALGKGMVRREKEEEGKNPHCAKQHHYLFGFFSLCFYAFTLKLVCLVDFPGCI